MSTNGGHFGPRSGSLNTILEGEKTNSEAETIRPDPITMATESMHSVSDPVPSPTQPYTTEEPGP